ncbi:hypothetical protein KI387_035739 [Taxus chinensis]|uniref:Uncharacterized protein n=1 Tax=Taxus chinensis TaxID=29808 RepID=A0AA38FRW1_TAXCH|nr:hypothetical protein KI387_035739 [Taxus chinensis]
MRDANRPKRPKDGPFRAVRRYLSPAVWDSWDKSTREDVNWPILAEAGDFRPGQLGQKYAWDAESRKSRQ